MPILSLTQKHSLQYQVDYQIAKNESDALYNRLIEQMSQAGYLPDKNWIGSVDNVKLRRLILSQLVEHHRLQIEEDLKQAIQEKASNKPILEPRLDWQFLEYQKEGFVLRFIIWLLPEINLENLSQLRLPRFDFQQLGLPSMHEFIESEKNRLLYTYNLYEETFSKSRLGSKLILNLQTTLDGKTLPSLSGPRAELVIGLNAEWPEWNQLLQGLEVTQRKQAEIKAPDSFANSLVAGKALQVSLQVLDIKQAKYSDLESLLQSPDAYRLRQIGWSLEAVELQLQKNYTDRQIKTNQVALRRNLTQQILELVPQFDLPISEADKVSEQNKAQLRLRFILQAILELKIDLKSHPNPTQVQELTQMILQQPARFGFSQAPDPYEARTEAQRFLQNEVIFNWLEKNAHAYAAKQA